MTYNLSRDYEPNKIPRFMVHSTHYPASLIARKDTVDFRNQRLWRDLAADYIIIMSRLLVIVGMYDHGAWFRRVINHVKFARFVLLAINDEAKKTYIFFVQCMIKQLWDSVFVIPIIIKVSVMVISLILRFGW